MNIEQRGAYGGCWTLSIGGEVVHTTAVGLWTSSGSCVIVSAGVKDDCWKMNDEH